MIKGAFPKRQPRRAFSSNDYRLPSAPATPGAHSHYIAPAAMSSLSEITESYFYQLPRILAHTPSPPRESHTPAEVSVSVLPGHRPPMWRSPQRSYSVMPDEPIPFTQIPGEKLQLAFLPPEIHYAIFDFLDPIDSTCLGLTSKHFYAIHRRMHGTVPLAARRSGPNDMEWAWRLEKPLIQAGATEENALAMLAPQGQVYCRKCGITRCELHKHIQEWIGNDYEYCAVREKFGPKAPGGTKKECYRSSPRHPHRCGRHTRQQRVVRLV
ncbi:uncharacterized protein BCR38DRAFT_340745 [Pseudomassariella vexata]|uniref:F-box domain-containing protein n=1 Tax=Pseudomassariella vexata TaxID=1141098 RepID=A0A1Y2E2J7_9PEZI|nr:uncharacterized protein BCR38DRAFT_340745 [Pseudomassariella vexata]ORY65095.1 hypothetical protein BCR38DRAFT_340745 [Pseudomassariella vexata]